MSLVDPGRVDAPSRASASVASRTTIVASLVAHAIAAAALVVVPLFAQVPLPAPARPIEAYVKAMAYDAIPVPQPPGRQAAPAASPTASAPVVTESTAAPLAAPAEIGTGEAPAMPGPGSLGVGVPDGVVGSVGIGVPAPPVVTPPPPAPPSTRPLRVGGDIRAPRKLHHVAPVYPAVAAQARIAGVVILEATIAPSGEVTNVTVLRSVPLLDGAAVAAVRQWRYDPPRLNGQPVAVLLTVTVQFAQ